MGLLARTASGISSSHPPRRNDAVEEPVQCCYATLAALLFALGDAYDLPARVLYCVAASAVYCLPVVTVSSSVLEGLLFPWFGM